MPHTIIHPAIRPATRHPAGQIITPVRNRHTSREWCACVAAFCACGLVIVAAIAAAGVLIGRGIAWMMGGL
jgi:hypothetical protein